MWACVQICVVKPKEAMAMCGSNTYVQKSNFLGQCHSELRQGLIGIPYTQYTPTHGDLTGQNDDNPCHW